MAEHPAVAFLVAELARVEQLAREAEKEFPSELWNDLAAGHSPAAVLRRVAADRQILAEHANDYGDCTACGRPSEETNSRGHPFFTEVEWPCRTVRLLGEAYGWTEETQ